MNKNAKPAFHEQELRNKITRVLEQAQHRGMDAAEAGVSVETGFSVEVRGGEVETVEHHQAKALQITVYHQLRSGSATTSDLTVEALLAAVDKACAIASYGGEDPCAGIAEQEFLAFEYPDLELFHHWKISPAEAIKKAIECDKIARGQDPRITDAEGTHLSSYDSYKIYGNTNGFVGGYPQSLQSLSCCVVAQFEDSMQREFEYTTARAAAQLDDIATVAKSAAQKVLQRQGARRLTTRRCPVIFHAPMARGLLSHFVSAISGRNLYQKASFLLNQLGEKIFPDFIHIYQEPHLLRALASAPFDSEGVSTKNQDYVRDGVLLSYILGCYSARQLKLQTTGNSGGVYNLGISHSDLNLEALLKKMGSGLLITELMGQGINIVTGNYSRGAGGFWVENGAIQYPVNEITVAGQLQNMFRGIQAISNDTDIRGSIRSGSILIDEMTIAGE
ncbi:MAG: metalloprotease PmbA [Proteobacteria bacterium]|nr:metalloprotease PmbA [Pseudomonadota bacterium]